MGVAAGSARGGGTTINVNVHGLTVPEAADMIADRIGRELGRRANWGYGRKP